MSTRDIYESIVFRHGRLEGFTVGDQILNYALYGYTDRQQVQGGPMPSIRPLDLKGRREWPAGFRADIKDTLGRTPLPEKEGKS